VGTDVNTKLLNLLAEDNSGTSEYILPGEDIKNRIGGFYAKITYPVLSDLSIAFADLKVDKLHPKRLPDLFKGQQLVIFGRYDGDGHKLLTLKGNLRGSERVYTYEFNFPKVSEDADFLPRLWAGRRIAYLLDEIKRRGKNKELIDEIVKLAKEYGIVTPYTSFLITEDVPVGAPGAVPILRRRLIRKLSEEEEEEFRGDKAVKDAKKVHHLKRPQAMGREMIDKLAEEIAKEKGAPTSAERMQVIGSKTFYLSKGVWYDASYKGDVAYPSGTVVTIEFGSTQYFKLLQENPGIARYLALGQQIVICYKGKVYKIVKGKK
jgi:Ca-activated chloride channel family protein